MTDQTISDHPSCDFSPMDAGARSSAIYARLARLSARRPTSASGRYLSRTRATGSVINAGIAKLRALYEKTHHGDDQL
jgi:hypothetical protein